MPPQADLPEQNLTTPERATLHEFLTDRFSLEELKTLAFKIGYAYDSLEHQESSVFARELLGRAQRDKKLADLLKAALQQRPDESIASMLWRLVEAEVVTAEVVTAYLEDTDSFVRSWAPSAEGEIDDSRAVEPLIAALKDEYSYTRLYAAYTLGNIDDSRAVKPLVAALKDKYGTVRESAAEALGKIGDSRALPELERVVREDRRENRWIGMAVDAAARAIKEIKAKQPVQH